MSEVLEHITWRMKTIRLEHCHPGMFHRRSYYGHQELALVYNATRLAILSKSGNGDHLHTYVHVTMPTHIARAGGHRTLQMLASLYKHNIMDGKHFKVP